MRAKKKIGIALEVMLLGIASLMIVCGVAQALTTQGDWQMNEGSGSYANDSTSNPFNNGTLQGSPTWITVSGTNKGLEFDGGSQFTNGDRVEMADNDNLDLNEGTGFKISAMIYIYSDSDNYHCIVDKYKYTSDANVNGYSLYLNNRYLRLSVYCGANGNTDLYSPSQLSTGSWYNLTAGWNGTTNKVYMTINGAYNGASWSYSPGTNSEKFCVGVRTTGWGGYMPFHGKIDYVTVYDR